MTLKLPFSSSKLACEVRECTWYAWMFQLRFKEKLSVLCLCDMFLSLFAMNQRYDCLPCMKTIPTFRIKMVVSVVQSIGIFFLLGRSKLVVSIVFALSRDIFLLKHVLKASEIEWIEYG